MKTVFNNQQCAHVWAQQTQPHGRSGSMHFDGDTLYSYQTPIAKFYRVKPDGHTSFDARPVVLITSETYSKTTSGKHMPAVSRALSGNVRTFHVPHVLAGDVRLSGADVGMSKGGTHLQNLDAIVARYVSTRESELRRIKVYGSAYDRLEPIQRDARAYAQVFGLPVPTLDAQADSDGIERIRAERKAKRETPAYLAAQARKEEIRLANLAARNLARFEADTVHRNRWLAGNTVSTWYGVDEKGGAYLRLSNDGTRVETSQGAHIPVVDARRVIPLIRTVVAEARPIYNSSARVGSFTVDSIAANGDIKAGCHFIQFAEIDKIGKLLGV